MIFEHIEVLFRLLIAHILADFVLQPSKWVEHRNTFRLKSKFLYFHVAIVAVLSFLAIGKSDAFGVMAVILISHFIFDAIKTYIYKRFSNSFYCRSDTSYFRYYRLLACLYKSNQYVF
ncbi:MAG: DUF3307 domain-containing protein [Bacteroidales bacterium]|nr:DUF3307 domain-containing protein [Bacteroidales bacterium]